MASTDWRARPIPTAAAGEWFAAYNWSRLRIDLPWRFGFSGGVARFVAIGPLVFSSDHAKLASRQSCRGADRIFHFGGCAAVAGVGADCLGLVPDFQQRELVARQRGDCPSPLVRAASREPLLRRRAALAETTQNHSPGCRCGCSHPSPCPAYGLAFRLGQRPRLRTSSSLVLTQGGNKWTPPALASL